MFATREIKAGDVITCETPECTSPPWPDLWLYNHRLEWALVRTVLHGALCVHEDRFQANLRNPKFLADEWFYEEDKAIRFWLVWQTRELPCEPDNHAWPGWSLADDVVAKSISRIYRVSLRSVQRLFHLAAHGLVTDTHDMFGQAVPLCLSLFSTIQTARIATDANATYELAPRPDSPHRVALRAEVDIATGEEITVATPVASKKRRDRDGLTRTRG